jgi:hypothetical protein
MLKINHKEYPVSLNKEYEISVDGKNLSFMLTQNDTLVYYDSLFSFKYLKDYKITKLVVAEGIEQIMIMSAEGSGMAIQKYGTLNPSMLSEMMLNEVTKESLSYGYEMKRMDYTRQLISGESVEVLKACLTYKDGTSIYEVSSYGKKDEGLIIMTIISNQSISQQGQDIINTMWKSLSVN